MRVRVRVHERVRVRESVVCGGVRGMVKQGVIHSPVNLERGVTNTITAK